MFNSQDIRERVVLHPRLGLGLDVNMPSLGLLLRNARSYFLQYPYLLVFPAVIVSLITITFYLVGNAFSDAADPRNHV